jgi:hypothetical protein
VRETYNNIKRRLKKEKRSEEKKKARKDTEREEKTWHCSCGCDV